MISPFGKFTRKLRIDCGELLKDMADKLGVTPSYLSAIENGKRNVPHNWINIIAELYSLNDEQIKQLKQAVKDSKIITTVDVRGLKESDKDIMVSLARSIDGMDKEQKEIIKKLLKKK